MTEQPEIAPIKHPPLKRRSFAPLLFTMLLCILVLCFGWIIYQGHKDKEALQTEFSSLKKDLMTAKMRTEKLNKQVQKVLAQRFYENQHWLLLKARYYLELAEMNARWTTDPKATIALLTNADSLLENIHSENTVTIRHILADDLIKLKALPAPDITGLLSQLEAAKTLSSTLPIKHQPIPKPTVKNSTIDLLKHLVIIQHQDGLNPLLITPLYETFIRERLQMSLQTAEWAIMQKNSTVLKTAIASSMQEIQTHFDENATATEALLKTLEPMLSIQLNPPQPKMAQPIQLIDEFIESLKTPAS